MFIYLIFESVELSTQANFRGVLLRLTVLVERSRWYIGDSTEPIYIWQRGFVRASRVLYLRMYVCTLLVHRTGQRHRTTGQTWGQVTISPAREFVIRNDSPTLLHSVSFLRSRHMCMYVPMYDLRTQGQYWLRNAITRCDVCLYVMLV